MRSRRSTASWSGTAFRIIVGTGLVVAAGLPLLYFLQFDFNPINLRSPKVESVATFLDLRSDPALGANSIYVLAPNKEAAHAAAETAVASCPRSRRSRRSRASSRPISSRSSPRSASSASMLEPALKPDPSKTPPTDADNVAALKAAVTNLRQAADDADRTGPARSRPGGWPTQLDQGRRRRRGPARARRRPR